MASVVIYLHDQERNALNQLAQQEYRRIKEQADFIGQKEFNQFPKDGTGGAV